MKRHVVTHLNGSVCSFVLFWFLPQRNSNVFRCKTPTLTTHVREKEAERERESNRWTSSQVVRFHLIQCIGIEFSGNKSVCEWQRQRSGEMNREKKDEWNGMLWCVNATPQYPHTQTFHSIIIIIINLTFGEELWLYACVSSLFCPFRNDFVQIEKSC